jgi:BirA family biotin operon repressor/biotin-[acetyl-CoA-carboxylase] ligase
MGDGDTTSTGDQKQVNNFEHTAGGNLSDVQDEFEGLETVDDRHVIGRRIVWHQETESTNDDVRRAAEMGEQEGLVVIADVQTAGRGRMSRTWTSPPGRDILFSVLLRPDVTDLPKMPLVAGLAVARTLDAFTNQPVTLKWPNDVRVADRKISGSLVESGSSKTGYFAVVGTGVNVNMDAVAHPEIAEIATSLRTLTGESVSRREVMRKLLFEMDCIYSNPEQMGRLVSDWSNRLETIGQEIDVRWGGELIHGVAEGVDETGRLLLRDGGGELRLLEAGEVTTQLSGQ